MYKWFFNYICDPKVMRLLDVPLEAQLLNHIHTLADRLTGLKLNPAQSASSLFLLQLSVGR
jgi:hypothetical protein